MCPTVLESQLFKTLPLSTHNFPSMGLLGAQPASATNLQPVNEVIASATVPFHSIMLRLRELYILDNFDGLLGQLGQRMEIKLVSLVYDGTSISLFKFEVGAFPGIKANQPLPFTDSGLALYLSEPSQLPRFIDWRLLIVEDDSDIRNAGTTIQKVQQTSEYAEILKTATALVNRKRSSNYTLEWDLIGVNWRADV